MPRIELTAKLRAYTRAPFHTDYIREAPKDDSQYVRLNGDWSRLDTTLLGASLEEFKAQVVKLQGQLSTIDIYYDYETNLILFIDSLGNSTPITLPGANVDKQTIGLTTRNQMYVMDTPDGTTIKVVDVVKQPSKEDSEIEEKVSGKLRVDAVFAETSKTYLTGQQVLDRLNKAEKNITDLEAYTQGKGGFLDPYNFGSDLRSGSYWEDIDPVTGLTNRHKALSQVAYDQLSNGTPLEIPDQTKIKNLFDAHIWVYISSDDTWIDEGADTVVNANNYGVLGAVTGVAYNKEDDTTKFKISIEEDARGVATGVMSVNGLEDEFSKVIYRTETDVEAVPDTYVKRSATGTISINDSVDDNDAINQGQFLSWQENAVMTDDDIRKMVNEIYIPELPL